MQSAVQMAMNAAVRASMSSMVDGLGGGHHQQSGHQSMIHHHQQSNHDQNSPTLRMQEAILRSQAEAALRLAVTQAVAASSGQQQTPEQNRQPAMQQQNTHQTQQNSVALNYNAMAQGQLMNGQNPYHHQGQVSPDLSEALRLQEQRLEQALRLHGGDPRALGFTFGNTQQGHINP